MGKLAFVFAGQGAQAVGMGKELAENFPIADKTFDEASEALGFDIKDMIWNGDSETLMITENTQPTIVTMSVAALRVLQEKGIKPDVVAGLSLGEYTAHIASGSMEFADGVRLVKKRGKYARRSACRKRRYGGYYCTFCRGCYCLLRRGVKSRYLFTCKL